MDVEDEPLLLYAPSDVISWFGAFGPASEAGDPVAPLASLDAQSPNAVPDLRALAAQLTVQLDPSAVAAKASAARRGPKAKVRPGRRLRACLIRRPSSSGCLRASSPTSTEPSLSF